MLGAQEGDGECFVMLGLERRLQGGSSGRSSRGGLILAHGQCVLPGSQAGSVFVMLPHPVEDSES